MLGLLSIAVTLFVFVGVIYISFKYRPDYVVINCSLAEISPDFSTDMREACRRARLQEMKK
jgi:hypothetical protein